MWSDPLKRSLNHFAMGKAVSGFKPTHLDIVEDTVICVHGVKSQIPFVEVPAGVKKIGNRVFSQCHELTYLRLPKTLTTVGW